MSDITKDDLRLPGKLLSQAELHTMWSLTRPPTDEEFDLLAREWVANNRVKALQIMLRDAKGGYSEMFQALLTDQCETCGGDGELLVNRGDQDIIDICPDCGGRGWLPNKKAQELLDNLHDYVAKAPEVAQDPRIFADWLETDDE